MNEEIIIENMKIKGLSEYASKYEDAIRLNNELEDIRPSYFRDIDRILYSLAYTRYIDKTQVFTYKNNDHISRRMTHVQYVSKIARTIGRALNLNEDLIEAASLGHDLGHTPFGHVGEDILNKISLKYGCGYYNHNIQSVRLLMDVENYGNGLNITIQVLDAIMCHNGEIAECMYEPTIKSKEEFLKEYELCYKDKNTIFKLKPMTLEGCVVRVSDLIAYLGKDIEDGIRMGLINESDIPRSIKDVLGTKNRDIVNTIIMDIIKNSVGHNYIKLSEKIYKEIENLKKFNYENIYYRAITKEILEELELNMNKLFKKYLEDLNNKNMESTIYKSYLSKMNDNYRNNNSNERIVIDYIAGMTDEYIMKQFELIK